jgi:hypothetical protein
MNKVIETLNLTGRASRTVPRAEIAVVLELRAAALCFVGMPSRRGPLPRLRPLLLLACLSACHHYVTPAGTTPEQYVTEQRPSRVRVTLADRSRHVVRAPWVRGDTLGGTLLVPDPRGVLIEQPGAWTVPLGSLSLLEVYRPNSGGTVALVATTVVVALAVAAYALYAVSHTVGG